jgi:hypothetical protein
MEEVEVRVVIMTTPHNEQHDEEEDEDGEEAMRSPAWSLQITGGGDTP